MRVASLTPSNTEILAFLDELDTLAARDMFSDWPPAVEEVPSVGPDLQIDVDALTEMDVDLVLAAESVPGMERVHEGVAEAGLAHVVLAPTSLAGIREDVRRVAEVLDVPDRGDRLADAMAAGTAAIAEAVEEVSSRTVYWEWWPDPPIAPGGGGWMSEVIETAGGGNVFAEASEQSFEVDLERVEDADPDVVGLCWQGTLEKVQSAERFAKRAGGDWGRLRAVEEDQVHTFPEALYGRPGPRIVEGIRRLAATLHPDRAEQLPSAYAWVPDEMKDRLPLASSS